MYKIMTIEDDKSLCINMNESLIKWGFMTYIIGDFEDITAEFASMKPDLVIMDVNLPYFDGFYWCGKIREISKVPIIFVSSRETNMDIIMAMNTGGDDYITKPFSMDILIAKINALLRRTYSYGEQPSDLVECDGVILNLVDNTLTVNINRLRMKVSDMGLKDYIVTKKGYGYMIL
ncbi:response regulator [Clostridium estertheticum]|uniref:Stage 0 sporulation protein A homolog n=1 Tax=Clostridium estertheticum TaxID=238834 RepID=A0A7Y3WQ14_9CLOT|nr:response regulator [Clostridium estertheticum]NNU74457.1 response regulator [Clostridium estertheticum]WBL49040.1 response regulator [Clostridium estertheticum]